MLVPTIEQVVPERRPTTTQAGNLSLRKLPSATAPPTTSSSSAAALLRLAGAVLVEAHDEWQTSDRRYLAEGTMALITTPAHTVTTTALAAA